MDKDEVLAWLEKHGTTATIDGMGRYGIEARRAFGVPMGTLLKLKKRLGTNHELSLALWESGWYEARLLAALVGDPQRVTARQMDAWAATFENWGDCDTVCFKLFDRTPFAWEKVRKWASSPREFVRRAAFALLWGLTVHDKRADDSAFVEGLRLIERAASDERHFVKKSLNMSLRAIGKRNAALNAAAVKVARRLGDSPQAAARWVGKDALRELTSPGVIRRLGARPRVPAKTRRAGR
jgi:3-methyladenine DNA glycosylase AlkD